MTRSSSASNIGIPRALIYWKGLGGKFWEEFFTKLGFEVVVSPSSNKEIVNRGVKMADQEACFATKVFFGHIAWLDEEVDRIFVPRLIKNKLGLEYCPRFFALPDLVSLTSKKLLTVRVNFEQEKPESIALKVGKKLNQEPSQIKKATAVALQTLNQDREQKLKQYQNKVNSDGKKVVVVSHPYNLYDDYVNLRMKEKLRALGLNSIFIDEVPAEGHNDSGLPNWHWEFGQEITNQIKEVTKLDLAGAIEISSFQCGCDAVLKEFVEKEFKEHQIPFLYLMIDEHTAEGGLQTRLEAFVDTLQLDDK